MMRLKVIRNRLYWENLLWMHLWSLDLWFLPQSLCCCVSNTDVLEWDIVIGYWNLSRKFFLLLSFQLLVAYLIFAMSSLLGYTGGFLVFTLIGIHKTRVDWLTFFLIMTNFAAVGVVSIFFQHVCTRCPPPFSLCIFPTLKRYLY